jgi:glycosyltransferase involved in cell wall biosynthesis
MSADRRALWLDITRLIGRAGAGPLTGIDRVERAYLAELIRRGPPFRLACRTALGWLVVAEGAAARVLGWIDNPASLPHTPALGRLIGRARKLPALEAALWAVSEACREAGLLRRLWRDRRPVWLSVGHANLGTRFLEALKGVHGLTVMTMIHDTIPLDHPDWAGPKAPDGFAGKLTAAVRHADLIVCPSGAAAGDVRRWSDDDDLTPLVAPLGVTPAAPDVAALPFRPAPPYFLALGTIEPRKDHALLLDVWDRFHATLPKANVPRLVIAGRRGWRNQAVFRRLDSAPVMGRSVIEANDLTDGAVAALLRGAAALVAPSRAEGFGLPVMEAAASGVPVIAADLPVTRELLGDWPVYAPAGEMYAWADAIITMARQADSGQGRPTPVQVPGWEAHFNLVFSRL